MNDNEFDKLAREALALDPGPPSASSWHRVQPVRHAWLPTIREILVCGSVSAVALCAIGLIMISPKRPAQPNPVLQSALQGDRSVALASLNRIDGISPWKPLGY